MMRKIITNTDKISVICIASFPSQTVLLH